MNRPDRPIKSFTMRLPQQEAIDFDRAILNLSASVGRRIDRTEAIRGLALLFVADDQGLANRVAAALAIAGVGPEPELSAETEGGSVGGRDQLPSRSRSSDSGDRGLS